MDDLYSHVTENEEDNDILYFDISSYIDSALRKLEQDNPDCHIELIGRVRVDS